MIKNNFHEVSPALCKWRLILNSLCVNISLNGEFGFLVNLDYFSFFPTVPFSCLKIYLQEAIFEFHVKEYRVPWTELSLRALKIMIAC